MEDKRRETVSQPPGTGESSAGEPILPRRRGGALKRKANHNNNNNNSFFETSSSTPFKRQAREKLNNSNSASASASSSSSAAAAAAHNGPLTRARQLSDNSTTTSSARRSVKNEVPGAASQKDEAGMEMGVGKEELEVLVAEIEARFEAIRSRDVNSHVVPVHAGWFSWKTVHPIEEQVLPSFFNGKSDSRNPEKYMEIRNWIMKKFHSDPNITIELKDLSDISVGDLDARQEIMEFLDHWGLINYHPFPSKVAANTSSIVNMDSDKIETGDSSKVAANTSSIVNMDSDKMETGDSLIEKLYQFENEHSSSDIVQTGSMSTPAVHARLFPESALAEELAKLEGPSVDYHCNSCSADCSRKRYHCQKEADFDLCSECYDNGKFGSGMSPSDFILMEPAEASGAGSGNWTDQETLLLLEALELYKENWNEITEHVATKTKAQCILHFLQMPIEDSFLESDCKIKEGLQEDAVVGLSNDDPSFAKNASEAAERKAVEDEALRILKEAFETVGSPLTPEHRLSFAQAGNPVMALTVFLMRLVGPGAATAAALNSLKLMHDDSPSMQLAARHCFFLEDAEDDAMGSDSPPAEKADLEAHKRKLEEGIEDKNHNEENSRQNEGQSLKSLDGNDSKRNDLNGRTQSSAEEENPSATSRSKDDCTNKSETTKEPEKLTNVGNRAMNEPEGSVQTPNSLNAMDGSAAKVELSPVSGKELTDKDSAEKPSKDGEGKDIGMVSVSTLPDKDDKNEPNLEKLRRAAISTVAAAVVKAKLLAEQEEDEIKQLAAVLIDKQLRKLEVKMSFFTEMENAMMRVKEHLDQSRQKLYHERAQIIATRLGLAASSSRLMAPSLSANRMPANSANLMPRPPTPMSMSAQRPPFSRPSMTSAPPSSGSLASSVVTGASAMQPSSK